MCQRVKRQKHFVKRLTKRRKQHHMYIQFLNTLAWILVKDGQNPKHMRLAWFVLCINKRHDFMCVGMRRDPLYGSGWNVEAIRRWTYKKHFITQTPGFEGHLWNVFYNADGAPKYLKIYFKTRAKTFKHTEHTLKYIYNTKKVVLHQTFDTCCQNSIMAVSHLFLEK